MEQLFDAVRRPIRAGVGSVARFLHRITGGKLTPNAVTWTGLAGHGLVVLLIVNGETVWAAVLLVFFGLFDTLDGELAKLQKRVSAAGMLLDSVTDRMKEIILYAAIAYGIIATTGRPFLAVWAVAACGVSLLVSYINASGDAVMAHYGLDKHAINKSFRGGLFPFEARMVVIIVGLLSNRLALLCAVIALGAGYTALSRLVRILRKLHSVRV